MVSYFKKILVLIIIFFFLGFSVVFAATLEIVSRHNDGTLSPSGGAIQPNGAGSGKGYVISYDGRYVVFDSTSALVAGDSNGIRDVFVRDRLLGTTERVSVSTLGNEADGASLGGTISYDGRHVLFWSEATNLVPGDTNGVGDLFVRDRLLGTTERVNVSSLGEEASAAIGDSFAFKISGNGRYVSFDSPASNLVPGDDNELTDVFIRDRLLGTTERIALDSSVFGLSYDGRYVLIFNNTDYYVYDRVEETSVVISDVGYMSLSGNGQFVTFRSGACDLASICVVVYDLLNETSEVVSVTSDGDEVLGGLSMDSSLSHDGRFVMFWSASSGFVPGYDGTGEDVYLHDRQTGITRLASVHNDGTFGNAPSRYGTISPGGYHLAFISEASNLADGDTNGTSDVFVYSLTEFPIDISISSSEINEGEDVGTALGTLSTEDPDEGDTHTYSFGCDTTGDDDTSFTIDGNSVLSAEVFDYNTQNEYNICIRTEDQWGAYFDKNFVVTILEVAPPPPPPTSISSGSYIAPSNVYGCTNPLALNFNPNANQSDKSCIFPIIDIPGCTNSSATNFNIFANQDNGSCVYTKEEPKIIEKAEVEEKKDVIEKLKTEPIEKKDESTEANSDEEFIGPSSTEEIVDLKKNKESKNLKSVLLIGTASLIVVFPTYNWARNLV